MPLDFSSGTFNTSDSNFELLGVFEADKLDVNSHTLLSVGFFDFYDSKWNITNPARGTLVIEIDAACFKSAGRYNHCF